MAVGDRVQKELTAKSGPTLVAQTQRRRGSDITARAVTRDNQARSITIQLRRVFGHPPRRECAIIYGSGEFMLRSEAIIH
jgi:hypothetical protein